MLKHPLINEIDKFLNRKLKLVVADAIGVSSEVSVLGAQLCCACADGDTFLLDDVINRIEKLDMSSLNTKTNLQQQTTASSNTSPRRLPAASSSGNMFSSATSSSPNREMNGGGGDNNSNLPPFLFRPFGLLHYVAFSNDPKIAETVLLNQSIIEKIVPVNANFAASVPPYTFSAHTPHTVPPHKDPSSIHFYTHLANGVPLLSPDTINRSTALHVAAALNNVLMCRLLIACGSSVRAQRTCTYRSIPTAPTSEIAKRLATPLYDALLCAGVHLANAAAVAAVEKATSSSASNNKTAAATQSEDGGGKETSACSEGVNNSGGDDSVVAAFAKAHLTLPSDVRTLPQHSTTLSELAYTTERQSCLVHPLFATLAILITNGADTTLLACPPFVYPPPGALKEVGDGGAAGSGGSLTVTPEGQRSANACIMSFFNHVVDLYTKRSDVIYSHKLLRPLV